MKQRFIKLFHFYKYFPHNNKKTLKRLILSVLCVVRERGGGGFCIALYLSLSYFSSLPSTTNLTVGPAICPSS
ncbi:hypothetical protein, partial [Marinomonas polaris]|uniref:hypothetical protein n=1 Tax=Marinomonas polaris TaxID=293552 RepID=UPI003F9965C9